MSSEGVSKTRELLRGINGLHLGKYFLANYSCWAFKRVRLSPCGHSVQMFCGRWNRMSVVTRGEHADLIEEAIRGQKKNQ